MARLLYSTLLYLLLPLVFVRLYLRAKKNPAYALRWRERLGWTKPEIRQPLIWIHAVSLGEVNAVLPLVKALQSRYAGHRFLITSTTPTGSEQIRKTLGNSVTHCYLPYDLNRTSKAFLQHCKPAVLILVERELWPNLIHHAHERRIPILLANARLSDRSLQRNLRFRSLLTPTVKKITAIAAQSREDADRLTVLGANPDSTHVIGNIKYDVHPPEGWQTTARAIQQRGDLKRPIWVAGSTHRGEETFILTAHAKLLETTPRALLILVPRHPERFDEVFRLCADWPLQTARRSTGQYPDHSTRVFLGDSMGELYSFYQLAEVCFVGGSLVPVGGHNVLEPALLGKPVVFGRHMENFQEIARVMLARDAAIQVPNPAELAGTIAGLLNDVPRATALGAKAGRLVAENQGALESTLALITPWLET